MTQILRLSLYCDGASRGNPGPSAYGYVLKDGETVVAQEGKTLGTTTNNVAEYQGLISGLERALKIGVQEIDIFADSELMIRQLKGEYKVRAPHLLAPFKSARDLLSKFKKYKLEHVRREFNKEADQLCNDALDLRLS